ncbi:MAG: DUF4373 domain-containing protein [Lachnospiraceae bacterium]|nr:DUF4373 domain-containing protein [Lachnospiraceae bacterium]
MEVGDGRMPRPPKKGLDYFPKDVGFYNDYKIMELLERYGPVGVAVYEVVLTEVYRNGYYLAEPIDRVSANVARIIGSKWVQKRLVSQVILDCGDIGLFETTLLKHGVITSVGIQRRYATVTSRNKVNKECYWLIDENGQPLLNEPKSRETDAETGVSVTETRETASVIPQKESKENKTKQNKKNSSELRGSLRPEAVFRLILLDGTYYEVCPDEVEEYRKLYPAIDVEQEYRKMIGWLDTHAKNRKTPKGIQKFINGWLCRAQDSARPSDDRKNAPAPNRFHNFEQSATDYDALAMQRIRDRMSGEEEGHEGT